MKALWLVLLAYLLSACATLSKEECLHADWHQIGFEDGSKGKDILILAKHRKACAKAGVTADRVAYENGYRQGLFRYCTYTNALSLGSRGVKKPDFCPTLTQPEFDLGYAHGVERFQKQQLINTINGDIQRIERQIHDYEVLIVHYETILTGETATIEVREDALVELRQTERDIKILLAELIQVNSALHYEQQQLQLIISRQQ